MMKNKKFFRNSFAWKEKFNDERNCTLNIESLKRTPLSFHSMFCLSMPLNSFHHHHAWVFVFNLTLFRSSLPLRCLAAAFFLPGSKRIKIGGELVGKLKMGWMTMTVGTLLSCTLHPLSRDFFPLIRYFSFRPEGSTSSLHHSSVFSTCHILFQFSRRKKHLHLNLLVDLKCDSLPTQT